MKYKVITTSILAASLSAFVVGSAIAQHDEHHPQNQTTQDQSNPGTTGAGMMGMMGQMMTHHQQMTGLMTKLMDSMTAIENEKDPAALKSKLAEHQALLEQMRTQMMQQGGMMQNMSGQMHKMMGDSNKENTK